MTLPIIYINVILLVFLMVAFLATGGLIGWIITRQTIPTATHHSRPCDTTTLIRLMARADHTLKTYLTALRGNLTVLPRELPTDLQRWQTSRDAIGQSAEQMNKYLERLRLYRIGLVGTTVRAEEVDLAQNLENTLIRLEPAAISRNISMHSEFHQWSQLIHGDALMLEEIFATLLDNAVRHNPPGTEVVAELTHHHGMAVVRIRDNGQGIRDELLPDKIFEQAVTGDPEEGTGMGLYIAKFLTEVHGGTIKVESQSGQGSVFTVALPLERRPE